MLAIVGGVFLRSSKIYNYVAFKRPQNTKDVVIKKLHKETKS